MSKATKQTCCGTAWERFGRFPMPVDCRNAGKVQRKGKWYCGIHDPEAVAAREAKRDEKHRSERSEDDEIQVEAAALAKQLGVEGYAEFQTFSSRLTRRLVISFDDAKKLIERIKRLKARARE